MTDDHADAESLDMPQGFSDSEFCLQSNTSATAVADFSRNLLKEGQITCLPVETALIAPLEGPGQTFGSDLCPTSRSSRQEAPQKAAEDVAFLAKFLYLQDLKQVTGGVCAEQLPRSNWSQPFQLEVWVPVDESRVTQLQLVALNAGSKDKSCRNFPKIDHQTPRAAWATLAANPPAIATP